MTTPRVCHPIDLARPLASVREAAGLTQAALAERRGVRPASQSEAESLGARIRFETLLRAAEAAGGELEIIFRRRS